MVYRELRETCSKLGEEMFSKSAEAGSKGTNYFLATRILFLSHCQSSFFPQLWKEKATSSGITLG